MKLAVQQALRNHQSQLSSSTGPSVQSTGFEGQEPRSCAVDATLGLIEGQEPQIPGIPANIIIIDQPEYKTRNMCSTAQDQPTPSLLPFPSMNLFHIRLKTKSGLMSMLSCRNCLSHLIGDNTICPCLLKGVPRHCAFNQNKGQKTQASTSGARCFNVVMVKYLTKFPAQAQATMKYSETVRRI